MPARPSLVVCLVPLALALGTLHASAARGQLASTTHIVTAGNLDCTGDRCTRLAGSWHHNHLETLSLVTSNWNPPGSSGVYYDAPVGRTSFGESATSYYHTLFGPPGAMPVGAAFNLLSVRGARSCLFLHEATAGNTVANVTFIDSPTLNNNPSVFLLVSNSPLATDPLDIGIYYDTTEHKWGIFREDLGAMPANAYFVVYIYSSSCSVGLTSHFAVTCIGPSGNTCSLGGVAAGNPRAQVLVTQLWSESSGIYNPHSIGVYYGGGEWKVFNEDLAAMPSGALFNVAVISVLLADDFEGGDLEGWWGTTP